MASLDRAYGARGVAIALGMAAVAGFVQGVLAAQLDYLSVKLAVGTCSAILMIMAGAISARRTLVGAVLTANAMAALFLLVRWTCWALMEGGPGGAVAFLSVPPWGWPDYLEAAGISDFWVVEAASMLFPALLGCLTGQERQAETG